jgi:hypothetical protein
MDAKAEKIALFRFGVIASLVLEPLPRGELTRRAPEIAARHYDIPASKRTSISVDTLLDWALRYRNGGFEALAPQTGQGTAAHHYTPARRSHRTSETRKPASYRRHSVTGVGHAGGQGHGRNLRFHRVSVS